MIILQIILVLLGVFLSALVLLQPGQSEGLAGALGGYGLQSPFGTKTARKIVNFTFIVAAIFLALVIVTSVLRKREGFGVRGIRAPEAAPAAGGEEEPGRGN